MFLGSRQQVDLHTLKVVTGIATQGAISKETQKAYYVTTFKLEVSTNGEDWMVYRHGKNHKVGWESCMDTPRKNNLDADRRHTFRENTQDGIYIPQEVTTNRKPSCWLQLVFPPSFTWLQLRLYNQARFSKSLEVILYITDFSYILDCKACFSHPIWFLLRTGQSSASCQPRWASFSWLFLSVQAQWITIVCCRLRWMGRNEVNDNKAPLRWLQLK